jgi:hypothetical protein
VPMLEYKIAFPGRRRHVAGEAIQRSRPHLALRLLQRLGPPRRPPWSPTASTAACGATPAATTSTSPSAARPSTRTTGCPGTREGRALRAGRPGAPPCRTRRGPGNVQGRMWST